MRSKQAVPEIAASFSGARRRRHCHDVGGVVPRAAVVVVLSVRDAVVDEQREERGRDELCVQPLDDLVAPHLDVD